MIGAAAVSRQQDDERFMTLALALGRRGLGRAWPNPAVGAVLVKDGAIVGRGWTQPGGRPHGETEALRRAGEAARGATLYVTLEPCSHHGRTPPCAEAIVGAGVARVVSALDDPNPQVAGAGHRRLREAGLEVDVGTGAEAARQAHAGHIRRIRDGRPHVMLKLAVSADDKAGLAGRRPVAITGSASRNLVHRLRAMSDAVLTGIGTVLSDDPLLTCRLPGMAGRSPVRVVLDRALRLPPRSRLLAGAHETPLWIFTGEQADADRERGFVAAGAEVVRAPEAEEGLQLPAVLRALAARGITRVMVEAGPILSAAFIRADLIDELVLLRAPHALGPDAIDALHGLSLDVLTRSPRLTAFGAEAMGEDSVGYYTRAEGRV